MLYLRILVTALMAFSVGLTFSGCLLSAWFTTWTKKKESEERSYNVQCDHTDLAQGRETLGCSRGEAGTSAQTEDAAAVSRRLSDLRL